MNDPIGRIEAVVVDCRDPATLARFWATMLGVEPLVRDDTWANVSDEAGGTILAFQQVPEPKGGKNRLHLDVHVADITVATAPADAPRFDLMVRAIPKARCRCTWSTWSPVTRCSSGAPRGSRWCPASGIASWSSWPPAPVLPR